MTTVKAEKVRVRGDRRSAPAQVRRWKNGHRLGKVTLLTLDDLDLRTGVAVFFKRIVNGVTADLAGVDNISTVEKTLITAFAGAAIYVEDLNVKTLRGEKVDVGEFAAACSTLVRIASKLGVSRRARDVSPTLEQYLEAKDALEEERDSEEHDS